MSEVKFDDEKRNILVRQYWTNAAIRNVEGVNLYVMARQDQLSEDQAAMRLKDTIITQLQRAHKASDELKDAEIERLKKEIRKLPCLCESVFPDVLKQYPHMVCFKHQALGVEDER